jgi:hypothetical protein
VDRLTESGTSGLRPICTRILLEFEHNRIEAARLSFQQGGDASGHGACLRLLTKEPTPNRNLPAAQNICVGSFRRRAYHNKMLEEEQEENHGIDI